MLCCKWIVWFCRQYDVLFYILRPMDIFDFFGSAVCHQIVERSFIFGGRVLPVCARCAGIYSGIFFSMLFFLLFHRFSGNKPYSTWGVILGACAFIPISIDGFFSYLGFWESNQFLRVITGSLAGVSLVGFLLLGANFDVEGENRKPIFRSEKEQLLLMGSSLLWGILLWMQIGNYFIISWIIVMGIVSFWTSFFYLILKNLLGKRKLPYWRLAFCGSFLIVLLIGVLRS